MNVSSKTCLSINIPSNLEDPTIRGECPWQTLELEFVHTGHRDICLYQRIVRSPKRLRPSIVSTDSIIIH